MQAREKRVARPKRFLVGWTCVSSSQTGVRHLQFKGVCSKVLARGCVDQLHPPPELVIHGADGRIDGVRYEELASMLLNVVQQQQTSLAAQTREIEDMRQRLLEVQELEKRFDEFTKQHRAN
jgi:hypothetical protein